MDQRKQRLSQPMTVVHTIHTVLQRYHQEILQELHRALLMQSTSPEEGVNNDALVRIYGQMQYHLGWVDQQLQPGEGHPGKLLRPKQIGRASWRERV